MEFCNGLVRLGDKHSSRLQVLPSRLVFPVRPQAGNRNELTVAPREIVRLLSFRCVFPLVVAGGGNETAPFLKRVAEHRLLSNRFGTSVERCESHFFEGLAPPVRD